MAKFSPIPVFVLNLERDESRRQMITKQLDGVTGFDVRIINGCYGPTLPDSVCLTLTQDHTWVQFKGTIGCFLSHVRAWEEIVKLSSAFAIVIEDDVQVENIGRLISLHIPPDAELVFINERLSAKIPNPAELCVLPMWRALQRLDTLHSSPGADGYLLTPEGAKKILAACCRDLYFGHVDGRLLRYATSEVDLAALPNDSWIGSVIRNHHHQRLMPALGLVRGYCLSQPIVSHRGIISSREIGDSADSP